MRPQLLTLVLALSTVPITASATSLADLCTATKQTAAGKYALCRLKADSAFSRTGDVTTRTTAYARCQSSLTTWFSKAALRYPGSCPVPGDALVTGAYIGLCSDEVTTGLRSGAGPSAAAFCGEGTRYDTSLNKCLPLCGNGVVDPGESCDGSDLAGGSCTSLGFADGTLSCTAGCGFDVTGCVPPSSAHLLSVTGQTTCWNQTGGSMPCPGSGQDGDLQRGDPLSFVDNGDGTVTDTNTGLVWERLSSDGSIHDMNSRYIWTDAFSKVAHLNTPPCFAGHCDWRLPNIRELLSIVDYSRNGPALSEAFASHCSPGCTNAECACVPWPLMYFWSSTSVPNSPSFAYAVDFNFGHVFNDTTKDWLNLVRAVRTGP